MQINRLFHKICFSQMATVCEKITSVYLVDIITASLEFLKPYKRKCINRTMLRFYLPVKGTI